MRMKKLLLMMLGLATYVSSLASTQTTVYYAVPSRLVGTNTVELKVNYQGDNEWWETFQMTNINKTYYGLPIYKAEFTDKYDGLGCIQFFVNGTMWDQAFGIKAWTSPSTYNGKIWVHTGTSWDEYSDDDVITPINITYHVQASNSWGYNWIPYTTWTGMDTSANPWNEGWYDYTVVYPFETIIFNDGDSNGGNGHQTGNITIDNSQSEYWLTYTKNGEGNGVTTSIEKPANWLDDYQRTGLTIGNFGTICLPFNATIEGATVFKIISKVEDGSGKLTAINLESVESLEAGKAYIFKATASTLSATTSGDYTVATSAFGMMGNLSATPVTVTSGNYVVSGNQVCPVGENVTVGQYKAYITLDGIGTANSRGANFLGFDETNGIENIQAENGQNVVYNLQGQRVTDAQKGLIIVGGKKMLRK